MITVNTTPQANILKNLQKNITKAPFFTLFSECSRLLETKGRDADLQVSKTHNECAINHRPHLFSSE